MTKRSFSQFHSVLNGIETGFVDNAVVIGLTGLIDISFCSYYVKGPNGPFGPFTLTILLAMG